MLSPPSPPSRMSLMSGSPRADQVVLEYLLPYMGRYMTTPVLEASHQAAASFLSTATPATLAGLSPTQQAALATPFAYQNIDLRPILSHQWAGAAPLEAGLIYYVRPSPDHPLPSLAKADSPRTRTSDHLCLPHCHLPLLLPHALADGDAEKGRQASLSPPVPLAHRAARRRLLYPLTRVRPFLLDRLLPSASVD